MKERDGRTYTISPLRVRCAKNSEMSTRKPGLIVSAIWTVQHAWPFPTWRWIDCPLQFTVQCTSCILQTGHACHVATGRDQVRDKYGGKCWPFAYTLLVVGSSFVHKPMSTPLLSNQPLIHCFYLNPTEITCPLCLSTMTLRLAAGVLNRAPRILDYGLSFVHETTQNSCWERSEMLDSYWLQVGEVPISATTRCLLVTAEQA
jgi:hypothetical protein